MKITVIADTGIAAKEAGRRIKLSGHEILYAGVSDAGKGRYIDYIQNAILQSDVIIIAVGTPVSKSGYIDISELLKVLKTIASCITGHKLIILSNDRCEELCETAGSFINDNLMDQSARLDIIPCRNVTEDTLKTRCLL